MLACVQIQLVSFQTGFLYWIRNFSEKKLVKLALRLHYASFCEETFLKNSEIFFCLTLLALEGMFCTMANLRGQIIVWQEIV